MLAQAAPRVGLKGSCVSSQNPVQRCAAHSKVRLNGMPFFFARTPAAMTSFRCGSFQYLAFWRSWIAAAFSGLSARHLRALFCQNSGSALYAAFRSAFFRCRSLRSCQGLRELCHFIACFRQQNFFRPPVKGIEQVRQTNSVAGSVMELMYPQNLLRARGV